MPDNELPEFTEEDAKFLHPYPVSRGESALETLDFKWVVYPRRKAERLSFLENYPTDYRTVHVIVEGKLQTVMAVLWITKDGEKRRYPKYDR